MVSGHVRLDRLIFERDAREKSLRARPLGALALSPEPLVKGRRRTNRWLGLDALLPPSLEPPAARARLGR